MTDHQSRDIGVATHADRLGFVIDAAAYFDAFADAVSRARRSVLILGWEVDSGIRLRRGGNDEADEVGLGDYLSGILSDNRQLEIHVLAWDWSLIYAFEREPWPRQRMGRGTHSRLHFELDDNHPVGASHHEKLVVIDDRVAFIGGIDLGRRRWDSRRHEPDDPRRCSPAGTAYRPFHDLQAVVSGAAARALGERARERWNAATGESLPGSVVELADDPWPQGVVAAIRDVPLAIVRTEPQHELFETEAWHRRALGAARRSIYLENQYLTASSAGDALVEALDRKPTPEVLVVTSRSSEGWLEQATMDARREQLLVRLREHDPGGDKVRAWWPDIGDGSSPTVHSKLTIVDDRLAYLGSANLSNRSMGLDTECGIVLDAEHEPRLGEVIMELRRSLLAEHLAVRPEELAEAEAGCDSLIAAVESQRGGDRTLRPIELGQRWPDWLPDPILNLADPERPVELGEVVSLAGRDDDDADDG